MPTELQTKESKAEWRVFVPIAEGKKLTQEVLGEKFGEHGKRSADGIEGRSDVYTVVNESIGLKRRGNKGRVELKVRTHVHELDDGQATGIEIWKKYKTGKGQAEQQTVDELSKILGEHGLITDGVMEVVAGSGENVEIVKARADKEYAEQGVTVEDALVEVNGKQFRSYAVEGGVQEVKNFLSNHDLGKELYSLSAAPGAIMKGYAGFLAHV